MPAPIEDSQRVPDWIRALVSDAPRTIPTPARSNNRGGDTAQTRAARELRRIIYTAIERFTKSMEFSLHVPGGYRSGVSFDDVLTYLADRDKDFVADSATLRRRVRTALMSEYEEADAIPLALEFRETAAEAILATIVARLDNRLRDVPIASNSSAYSKWKLDHGFDTRVGQRTSKLRNAIDERGRVTVKANTR